MTIREALTDIVEDLKSQPELHEDIPTVEEAKARDHRKLGKELELLPND